MRSKTEIITKSGPLDLLDVRIVEALDRDSSSSIRTIAKRLKIPEETARYRVNRLLSSGLVATCYAVIDPGLLGAEVHKVLLKLHSADENAISRIVETLKKNPLINWIVRLDGMFDLAFTVWVRRIVELSELVDDLKSSYHKFIYRVAFAVNIQASFLPRVFGEGKLLSAREGARYSVPERMGKFDSTDLAILHQLTVNPRVSHTEVGKSLSITSETVSTRISKLEKSKIITGYRLAIDCAAWGLSNYYVTIYLRSASRKRLDEFLTHCERQSCVTYVIRALGEWDVELNIEVRDSRQYRDVMIQLTRDYSDLVREYYGMLVPDIYRFSILPAGLQP